MANSLEAKIVVLGSQGVGKTSLVHRYVKNAFTPPETQSTIGASFLTKRVVDIDSSTVVRLQIWDTAGQERFRSISKLYYRGMFVPTGVTPTNTETTYSPWFLRSFHTPFLRNKVPLRCLACYRSVLGCYCPKKSTLVWATKLRAERRL
jgi:hypothetical protein